MSPLIFILGRVPALSQAELAAVLGHSAFRALAPDVLRLDASVPDPVTLISRLGGTVKIGELVTTTFVPGAVAEDILQRAAELEKINFGLSWYGPAPTSRKRLAIGLEIKKLLRQAGKSCRLVTSTQAQLSSVVVRKNHCYEYLILPDGCVARTAAVQDFADFAARDVGRPHRDVKSGTLPPKLARVMVNLAKVPAGGTLLDPFCGSGTILTEAVLSGVREVCGVDLAQKAVTEAQKNLQWLSRRFPQTQDARWSVGVGDARQLGKNFEGKFFDAIVTEPYLGPPRRGRETKNQLDRLIKELAELYAQAFSEFRKIIVPRGRVVFAQPAFVFGKEILNVPIVPDIKNFGFTLEIGPLDYYRSDQLVRRQIYVWGKAR